MALVSANQLSLEKTLEELIKEFNALRSDVTSVTLESLVAAASAQIVFEGATDDANETTLTAVDPTADRTITLPDATGTVVTTGNADAGATTTTFADLDHFLINDGGTLKKMSIDTALSSLPALIPSSANANAIGSASLEWSDLFLGDGSVINFGNDQDTTLTHTDGAGLTLNSTNKLMFNDASQFIQGASATILDIAATDEIELTATLIDVVGNFTISGTVVGASTIQGTTITATTAFVPDAQDGAALGTTSLQFSDLFLADSAVIGFGDDNDTTLTHTDGAGLTLNSTNKLMFNDASQFIQGASSTVLDIAATDEIELTATLIDVVGNLDVSGTVVGASTIQGTTITATTAFVPDAQDGAALGTTSLQFSDLFLADGAVLGFGDNNEVTLTHVHDTGILLNSTMAIQFNDASQFINAPSNAILDINATDEIELNATLLDVNANINASGTYTGAGTMTTGGNIVLPDAGTIGSATDVDAIAIGSDGDITLTQDLELQHDGAILSFGANDEVTLTHVHDTGILLNSTNVIQFNDASQNIGAPSNAILDINATDEIELNATLVDINANVEISGNLTVSGTTIQVDTITMNATNAIVFEGATADDSETTLTIVDPTADRTITLPDATGTVVTTGNADAGATTTTFADLDHFLINDGGTLKKMSIDTALSSLPALIPSSANANAIGSASLEWSDLFLGDGSVINFGNDQDTTLTHTDGAGLTLNSTNKLMFNDASQFIQGASATILDIAATDEIELTATLIDVVGNFTISGTVVGASTIQGTTITATTAFVPDAQDGAALGTTSLQFSDLFLADSAVIGFGDDNDTTLTHTDGAGLTLNSTNKLMFNDASQFIQGASSTVLDIAATDEIELTATLIDVVGNLDVSGTVVGASTIQGTTITATTAFVPDAQDGAALGTTSLQFSDLFLADGAVLGFGDNNEVTLTHVHDTGILLNSTMAIQFNDASQFINAPSNAILDINATDEIELNATLLDVNANINASGTYTGAGTMTTGGNIVLPDAGTIGSATDVDAIAIGSDGDITLTQDLELQHDGAILSFGANDEVTLTHVHDTGILLNSTNVIQFNDASQNIGAPSNAILDINATDEIELNATLVDINANVEISGNLTVSGTTIQVDTITMNATNAIVFEGATADDSETTLTITDPTADRTITLPDETGTVHTSGGSIVIPNAANIGSAGDADAIAIAANGVVTFSQIPVMPANSIDSDQYIDGSIDTAHYAAGSVDAAALGADSVTAAKIGDNVINSEHYAAGSIDAEHMSANSIDSDSYVDGSIDRAHLAGGIIDGTKLADNAVDSEHYTDGSIDTEHYADDSITEAKIANDAIGAAELKSVSTLLIKNAAGGTLKTLYGAGA